MPVPGKMDKMLRYVFIPIIILLTSLGIYLFVRHDNHTKVLEERITSLEARLGQQRDDYETRIAHLKAELAKASFARAVKTKRVSIIDVVRKDVVKNLPSNPEKVRSDALFEVRDILKLDDAQDAGLRQVLADFEKSKGKVFERAKTEKRFIFETKYLDMINQARTEAMEKLASVLSGEQIRVFKEKDLDLKLGLRVMAKAGVKSR